MASGTTSQPAPAAKTPQGKLVQYDDYIDQTIRKTSGSVKAVDIASGLLTMAAGAIGYLWVMALVEHWLITGGLGFRGRLLALAGLVAAESLYFVRFVLPLLVRRINPIFAAHTIEQSTPSLKNSLLNFLLFRRDRADMPEGLYQAIEEQAASRLSKVPAETTVDRSAVLHVGYVLLAIVAIGAAYKLISPKDPLATAGRVLMPWADIQPPTRVRILDVQPGQARVAMGEQLTVSAVIEGLGDDEPVTVYYTTADRQAVDRPLALHVPPGKSRYQGQLPESDSGIGQDLVYRIEAADAVSPDYPIHVTAAPAIVVQSVTYDYPDYTGLSDRVVPRAGDIDAIEGTRATVVARANQTIRSAHVDLGSDGQNDLRMSHSATQAQASFTLKLDADSRQAWRDSYQLRFTNEAGQQNRQPVLHRIVVTPDLPPEVTILAPKQDEVEVPLSGSVSIEVHAGDPDFALARVELVGRAEGLQDFSVGLLDQPHGGQFVAKFDFVPKKYDLKPGDVVEYWAVAYDNKTPDAQTARTARRRIRVTADRGRAADGRGRDEERGGEAPDKGRPAGEPQPGEPQPGEPQRGEPAADAARPDRPDDGERQPGEPSSEGGQPDQGEQGAGSPDAGDQGSDGQTPNAGSGDDDTNQQSGDDAADRSGSGAPSNGAGAEGRDGQDAAGQSGEGSGGAREGSERRDPVPSDGSDDGSAFEELLRNIKEPADPSREGKAPAAPNEHDPTREGKAPAAPNEGDATREGKAPAAPNEHDPTREGKAPAAPNQGDATREGKAPAAPNESDATREGKAPAAPNEHDATREGKAPAAPNEHDATREGKAPAAPNEHDPTREGKAPAAPNEHDATREGKAPAAPNEHDPTREGKAPAAPNEHDATREGKAPAAPNEHDPTREGKAPAAPNESDATREGKAPAAPDESDPRKGNTPPRPESDPGPSGAGEGQGNESSPGPEESARPRDKKQEDSQEESLPDKRDPQSPSRGKNDTNNQGREGDRKVAGQQGGGRKADRPGTGSPGENTPADDGSGQSAEPGEGQAGGEPGASDPSQGTPGTPRGDQQGPGSRKQAASPDRQGQPQPGGRDGNDASEPANPEGGEAGGGGQRGAGGGQSGSGQPAQAQSPQQDPAGDQPNLDYAKEATDLVLRHLKDQMAEDQVDRQLLDRLGWTREDIERFVRRWEKMKQDARGSGPKATQAQRELDDALRSLGLRKDRIFRRSGPRDDGSRNLRESYHGKPPREYQDLLRDYLKGTAKAATKR